MTQPQKQPDKEPESLTKEFNFPGPWIRDYNPAIHGVKPGMGGTPPVSGPLPQYQDAKSGQLPAYSDAKSGQLPAYQNTNSGPLPAYQEPKSGQLPTMPAQADKAWQSGPIQFNPTGVYGGEAEKQKGLPAWAWTLISAAVLIIVLLLLFFVILK